MRISDWSSDVCSSDLGASVVLADGQVVESAGRRPDATALVKALSSDSDNGVERSASGAVYRTDAGSIVVAVPLMRADDTIAGAVVLQVERRNTRERDRKSTRLHSSH